MAAALIAVRAVRAALNTSTSASSLSVTSASSYATKSGVTKQKKSTAGSGSGSGASKPSSPPPPASSKSATPVVGKNVDPPSIIFKKVEGPVIGPGASKEKDYKNPEYFMYHNMSYADMDEVMVKFRLPQPSSLKK